MTPKRARALAATGWVLSSVLLAATTVVIVANRHRGDTIDLPTISVLVFVLAFTTMGALAAARRPDIPIGWLLLASGFGYAFAGFGTSAIPLIDSPHSVFLYLDVITGWVWGVSITLVGVYLLLRFPTGRLLSRRWRVVEWAVTAALVVFAVGVTFKPGRVEDTPYDNPMGIPGAAGRFIGHLDGAFAVAFFASIVGIVSLGIRYRRSRGVERSQLKWVVYGAGVLAVGLLVEFLVPEFVHDQEAYTNVQNVISTLSVSFLPIAIGIAVLRYRLWDIDRLINRTIVYLLLTVVLVGVYAGLVVGLGAVTGRTGNPLVIAGSTLVVAALFGPARRRIQALIDRRFFRQRYDSERVLAAFSTRLRDELDMASLSGELREAVTDAVQPSTVGLWIRGTAAHRPDLPIGGS
jgi:uncharacterized membrane protein YidH (DUF202 family)